MVGEGEGDGDGEEDEGRDAVETTTRRTIAPVWLVVVVLRRGRILLPRASWSLLLLGVAGTSTAREHVLQKEN